MLKPILPEFSNTEPLPTFLIKEPAPIHESTETILMLIL